MNSIRATIVALAASAGCVLAAGCAGLPHRDPVEVYVVGIEPMPGEGLEMRMNVKLRVQNPNDTPIEYNGVSLTMDLQGKSIASGVSDAVGSVPRFGEAVIDVPITVSAFRLARGAASVFNTTSDKINYSVRGKLAGPIFKSVRFTSSGEVALPKDVYNTTK